MSGTLYLQCRAGNEPWHTLNSRSYSTLANEREVRDVLQDFQRRWSRNDDMASAKFRIASEHDLQADSFMRTIARKDT